MRCVLVGGQNLAAPHAHLMRASRDDILEPAIVGIRHPREGLAPLVQPAEAGVGAQVPRGEALEPLQIAARPIRLALQLHHVLAVR